MERIGFPVFNLNSYNESKKAYEDGLKGLGNYEVKQILELSKPTTIKRTKAAEMVEELPQRQLLHKHLQTN